MPTNGLAKLTIRIPGNWMTQSRATSLGTEMATLKIWIVQECPPMAGSNLRSEFPEMDDTKSGYISGDRDGYFTVIGRLSEWLLNSGAYMHWMLAMPVWYLPFN